MLIIGASAVSARAQIGDTLRKADQQSLYESLSPPLTSGFGVRAGAALFNDAEAKFAAQAFYQVPIGSVLLSPGFVLMTGGNGLAALSEFNSSFGLELWIIFPGLRKSSNVSNESFGSFGGEFMIWGDRVSAGIPLAYSYDIGLTSKMSLDLTGSVTPMFFLGGERMLVSFSILAGLRFTGQDEY